MPDPFIDSAGKVNVLLIGGGGREHALAWRLSKSPRLGDLWITHPDNPGLAALGKPVDVPVSLREIYRLEQFCRHKKIGLVVIGPEDPLAEGYADRLASENTLVFGPTSDAARIESDKAWAKQLMRGASVPTAEARIFTDPEAARAYLETRVPDDAALTAMLEKARDFRDPADRRRFINRAREADRAVAAAYAARHDDLPVIKAAGLAKGKGVIVPSSLAEGLDAIDRIMVRKEFADAGRQLVIEERLEGPEISVLALVDGRNILILPPCQDHKRLLDHDAGPNTGGMGAYCPADLLDADAMEKVCRDILVPTVDAMRREGIEYRGVLYAGLMLTPAGPKVLEFNCRFGDPECEPLMARLTSDLVELMLATCQGRLDSVDVQWDARPACCVVMASPGYPDKPKSGLPITGLDRAASLRDVSVFHAGTKKSDTGQIVTSGGRVLAVTALGTDLDHARASAYTACDTINFEGKHLRRDIAAKAAVKH